MSKGIEKPKTHHLQDDLNAIFEIPERINHLDIVRLKELIIYIKSEVFNRLKFINELLSVNPNTDFEYWAIRYSPFRMTYYDLNNLKLLIEDKLTSSESKPQPLIDENFQSFENYNRFKYCRDHAKSLNRRYVSILYGYFKNKGLFKFRNQLEFAEYWNKVDKGHKIKINVKSAGIDPMSWDSAEHDEIERLIKECNVINNYVKVE
jgi:hypothetical protein